MRIIVPNLNSDSSSSFSSSDESFQTAPEFLSSPSFISLVNMSSSSKNFDIEMGEASANALRSLSADDIQELVNLLAEKRSMGYSANPVTNTPSQPNHLVTLPKWNGNQEDFSFYMDRLRIRVEKEMAPYKDPSSICLDIIDTLPENKKSRLASWFSKSKKLNKFNWQDLLDVIQREFEDIQAQQTAHELVLRMEQGRNQYFQDFVKDFEHKIASCGGEELFTPAAKTRQFLNSN